MATKKPVIAVGYSLDLSSVKDRICDILDIPSDRREYFITEVKAGVAYSHGCHGGLGDVQKSQGELRYWYEKRAGVTIEVKISELHVNGKKTLLAANIRFGNDIFLAFLYNENNVSTTFQKKEILSGQGSWSKIVLSEPWMVPTRAYIYHAS